MYQPRKAAAEESRGNNQRRKRNDRMYTMQEDVKEND